MKLLMWDIDGTLIHGKGSGRIAMNRAFERRYGIKDVFGKIYLAGSMDINTIQTIFDKCGIQFSQLSEYLAAYYDELRLVLEEGRSELLPGVIDVLDRTEKEVGVYNALGTGNVEPGARMKLEQFNLNHYFPVGGFSVSLMERFEMVMDGVVKSRVYYDVDFALKDVVIIGDTVQDVQAGHAWGMRVISVATGGNRFDELEQVNPGRVLNNLFEIDKFFELIN